MLTDRDALLAGILANPDADLPRLVFADWLEETGHPANCARAEYIRAAIEENRSPAVDAHRPARVRRVLELATQFRDEFDVALSAEHRQAIGARRSRGFVESVAVPWDLLPEVGGALDCVPIKELIAERAYYRPTLPPRPEPSFEHWGRVREARCIATLEHIQIRTTERLPLASLDPLAAPSAVQEWWGQSFPLLGMLLSAPRLTRLKRLTLNSGGLSDFDVVELVSMLRRSACWETLQELDLSHNRLTHYSAQTLASADWPVGFRHLNVNHTQIDNAGREILYRRFGFAELRPLPALA